MKGIELDFLQEFSFQICLSRGATFPYFRERRWSNISFFCSAVRFPGTKRGAVGAKVVDVADKVGCFRPKTVDFSAKSTAFFSPSGEGDAPSALRGEKSSVEGRSGGVRRRFRAWGCIGEPIYKEGGALFGTETLCISRKTLNSQLVKNVFGSACAHRWSLGRTKKTLPCLAFFT